MKAPQITATDVERYGKMVVSIEVGKDRYQVYKYKSKFIEIEKTLGEITEMKVNHIRPKYLTQLIVNGAFISKP